MLIRVRRRAFLVPAVILWLAGIPVTLTLASDDPPRERVVVAEAGVMRSPLPTVSAPVDRLERVGRTAIRVPAFQGRDGRRITAARLRTYLRKQGSPMAPYADALVSAGIRYRIDPRSIVAIAGVESSFGNVMACFNAWGWDRGACRWSGWREAINNYSRVVSAAYPSLRQGDFLTAGRGYNPANWEQWAARCRAYFRAI